MANSNGKKIATYLLSAFLVLFCSVAILAAVVVYNGKAHKLGFRLWVFICNCLLGIFLGVLATICAAFETHKLMLTFIIVGLPCTGAGIVECIFQVAHTDKEGYGLFAIGMVQIVTQVLLIVVGYTLYKTWKDMIDDYHPDQIHHSVFHYQR